MMKPKGFTLVEIIIAVALIAILSAIASIAYQTYIVRSQLISALAELNGGKTQYELVMSDGAVISAFSPQNMFFSGHSNYCTYVVHPPEDAPRALECELTGSVSSVIKGKKIYLDRALSGTWKCSTSNDIASKYKPTDCF